MSITIGSFNLYKFGGETNKKTAKNFAEIARIIRSERLDIIALQEVFSEMYLRDSLMPYMKGWDYIWKESMGKEITYKEGYAFLWRKDKYEMLDKEKSDVYKSHGAKKKLVRPPFVARFIPKKSTDNGFMELRLISTHMVFGKPSGAVGSDADYRKEELAVLTEEIYPRIADKRYGDNRPAYTVLMGDYNLCIQANPKIGNHANREDQFVEIPINQGAFGRIPGREDRMLRVVQSEKTSLKRPTNDLSSSEKYDVDRESDDEEIAESGSVDFYSKDYDHFTYDVARFRDIGIQVGRVDALGKYYDNDLARYRKEISDHVPIKIRINLKGVK